jgi:hypothetical protein
LPSGKATVSGLAEAASSSNPRTPESAMSPSLIQLHYATVYQASRHDARRYRRHK